MFIPSDKDRKATKAQARMLAAMWGDDGTHWATFAPAEVITTDATMAVLIRNGWVQGDGLRHPCGNPAYMQERQSITAAGCYALEHFLWRERMNTKPETKT